MTLNHDLGMYEERINHALILKKALEKVKQEGLSITLEVSNNYDTKKRITHYYTKIVYDFQDLIKGREEAIGVKNVQGEFNRGSFGQRFGTYITHFKDGNRVKKGEYDKAFDETASELGIKSRDRASKNLIKQALTVKGYTLGLEDRWTSRGWNEVQAKLEVTPIDYATEEKIRQFASLNPELKKTRSQIDNLKQRILKQVLKARGKTPHPAQYFTIHYWKGYRVVSVFQKGRIGLVTRVLAFS